MTEERTKSMKGNNELRLCWAEMVAAMQMYVDSLMPDAQAKVQSVKEGNNDFVIKLAGRT